MAGDTLTGAKMRVVARGSARLEKGVKGREGST